MNDLDDDSTFRGSAEELALDETEPRSAPHAQPRAQTRPFGTPTAAAMRTPPAGTPVVAPPAPKPAAVMPAPVAPMFEEFDPEEHTVSSLAYAAQQAAETGGPVVLNDPAVQARLAGLAGLSLDRDSMPAPAQGQAARTRSAKLPWILLVLFVTGGTAYHVYTVRELRAEIAESKTAPAPGSATEQHAPPPRPTSALLASGYIAAKAPIVLSATSSGRLQELKVDNGDAIKKGQVVAVLDDSAVRAEYGLAAAHLRDAQRAASRMRMLAKAQAATAVDLEKAVGQVEVANAEVHVVQQKLDQMKIKAPIDGTVLEVLAHPGESLTSGAGGSSGILRIADLKELIAEVDVAEAELKNVYTGQQAEISSDSLPGRAFHGIVREIAEQADRARGTVQVKVEIMAAPPAGSGSDAASDPAAAGLKPGMAVQVRFQARPL